MSEADKAVCGLGSTDAKRKSELGLSVNAERVLKARYLRKDEEGRCIESPRDLFRRVAKSVAHAELVFDPDPDGRSEWEERFYALMAEQRFMPNSPTLMNAGREMGMLSACFVLPVGDSINEIFDSIKHTALIQKAGGGTGFAFDELRPTGDYIRSSGGTTSGPISFWRAFSEATNAIQQGAFRRGANMGMMYIHHPDILKFLHAKEDLSQFTNYNISVKITDAWMEAYRAAPNGPHLVENPRTGKHYAMPRDLDIWSYDLRSLTEVGPSGKLPEGEFYTRQEVWDIIVRNAHRTGEPGVVFIDRINEHNPTPRLGRIEATNPCGEQPLLPYEACNLGSVNLACFVRTSDRGLPTVDWEALKQTIHDAVRFLDNVIEINNYPIPEIEERCRSNRKIGLGVMGFADALFALGVGYNTEEGIAWGERFMSFLQEQAHQASEELAAERGVFPNWEGSIYDTQHNRPQRNATCTTVAPTGTISIIAGCSGGIEPLFSLAFYRNVLRGQDQGQGPMIEVNSIFERVARERGLLSEGLMERLATDGSLAALDGIPDDIREVFVCAHDIEPDWHVRMQSAFQAHCDSSISKTINFPHEASVDDVAKIYTLAYDLKCKGVTVYRDGCREHQPMALQAKEKAEASEPAAPEPPKDLVPATLPEISSGVRLRQLTPFGNMHINITVDPRTERELEVFAQLGKGGDLANSDLEAICRMVSLWLRSGGRLDTVIRQLLGIGSSLQVSTKEGRIMSLGDGLARALKKYVQVKNRAGLRALLLGEETVDGAEPVAPPSPTKGNGHKTSGSNGNGNGNGHAKATGHSNGNGNGKTKAVAPTSGNGHSHSNGNGNGNGHTSAAPKTNGSNEPVVAEQRAVAVAAAPVAVATGPAPGGIQWQQAQYKVVCPDCQANLRFGEGCVRCESCGYAEC